jgi:hypothetical protein
MTKPMQDNSYKMTEEQRQAFGEYVLLQQAKGRQSLSWDELNIVIETIKITLS